MPMYKKIFTRKATGAIPVNILLKGQLVVLNKEFDVIAVSCDDIYLKNEL